MEWKAIRGARSDRRQALVMSGVDTPRRRFRALRAVCFGSARHVGRAMPPGRVLQQVFLAWQTEGWCRSRWRF